jgi:hypothetical protein
LTHLNRIEKTDINRYMRVCCTLAIFKNSSPQDIRYIINYVFFQNKIYYYVIIILITYNNISQQIVYFLPRYKLLNYVQDTVVYGQDILLNMWFIYVRKLLNSAPGALIKHIKIEILSPIPCIQYLKSIKSYLWDINFIFYFLF